MDLKIIGRWSFIFGVVIAVLAGLGGKIPALTPLLFFLGFVVGFLNISEKESTPFLVAVVALIITGTSGLEFGRLTEVINAILQNIIVFSSAAGIVVAVKEIADFARKPE